jgi:hypothetical protein
LKLSSQPKKLSFNSPSTKRQLVGQSQKSTMSKKGAAAADQIIKLIVGAGQASPGPPVGPALGSKGVKSMDFCKVRDRNTNTFCLRIAIRPCLSHSFSPPGRIFPQLLFPPAA